MSPFGNSIVSGYQLATNRGDIYSFGITEFYGTIMDHFADFNSEIVSTVLTPNGQYLVTPDGCYFLMGPVCEKGKIDIGNEVITDCTYFLNQLVLISSSGKLFDENGLFEIQLNLDQSKTFEFVSFCVDNLAENIFALTKNGKVFSTKPTLLLGDFETIDVEGVEAVSICSHPHRKGYWIIDSIGGVFCFGAVDYFGSVPGDGYRCDAKKIQSTPSGSGYSIIDKNGMVLPYGDAIHHGAPVKKDVTGEIVSFDVWTAPNHSNHDVLFEKLVQNDINQLLGIEVEYIPEPEVGLQ